MKRPRRLKPTTTAERAAWSRGVKAAVCLAAEYDRQSSHPHLVSDCIAQKLNVVGTRRPRPNPCCMRGWYQGAAFAHDGSQQWWSQRKSNHKYTDEETVAAR